MKLALVLPGPSPDGRTLIAGPAVGDGPAASDVPANDPVADDPATCSNSVCNGTYYVDLFKNTYGAADAQWIPIDLDHVPDNASRSVVDRIDSMTGFFFGGGGQSRLVTTLLRSDNSDSPALAAIRAGFAAGAAVMGTSAGTDGVSVLDLRSAAIGTHSGYWSVDDVRWSYLTSGDSYHPATWTADSPKPAHSPGTGTVGRRWSDVFSSPAPGSRHPYQMVKMATELVNAGRSTHQYGISYESGPTFEADLTKGAGYRAWKSGTAVSFADLTTRLYVH